MWCEQHNVSTQSVNNPLMLSKDVYIERETAGVALLRSAIRTKTSREDYIFVVPSEGHDSVASSSLRMAD